MRKNTDIYCNGCGRKMKKQGEILREDILHVEKSWGYFSGKDTQKHSFDLCEDCYENMIQGFAIPVQIEEERELL